MRMTGVNIAYEHAERYGGEVVTLILNELDAGNQSGEVLLAKFQWLDEGLQSELGGLSASLRRKAEAEYYDTILSAVRDYVAEALKDELGVDVSVETYERDGWLVLKYDAGVRASSRRVFGRRSDALYDAVSREASASAQDVAEQFAYEWREEDPVDGGMYIPVYVHELDERLRRVVPLEVGDQDYRELERVFFEKFRMYLRDALDSEFRRYPRWRRAMVEGIEIDFDDGEVCVFVGVY